MRWGGGGRGCGCVTKRGVMVVTEVVFKGVPWWLGADGMGCFEVEIKSGGIIEGVVMD